MGLIFQFQGDFKISLEVDNNSSSKRINLEVRTNISFGTFLSFLRM